jgi:hypothetical protein
MLREEAAVAQPLLALTGEALTGLFVECELGMEIAAHEDALAAIDLRRWQERSARIRMDAQEMGNLVGATQPRHDEADADAEDERQHDEDGRGTCLNHRP